MARKQGFRLVEVVNLLTEVTGMLSTAIRKAGGEPIDQNQFFTDLQELVKRYGNNQQTPPAMASATETTTDYNLAADLLTGAILSHQVGKEQEAWNNFQTACQATGIEQILAAFESYNNNAMANDEGVDPTVTDNRLTDADADVSDEDTDEDDPEDPSDRDDQVSNVAEFMQQRQSRLKPASETIALANKLSQSGSRKARKMVRLNFIK